LKLKNDKIEKKLTIIKTNRDASLNEKQDRNNKLLKIKDQNIEKNCKLFFQKVDD